MPCRSLLTAAGIRLFIKSRFHLIRLREAVIFVLIAVLIVPLGTAFWGAAFTVSNGYRHPLLGRVAQSQHLEWRDGDRAGAGHPDRRPPDHRKGVRDVAPRRMLEACVLAVGILAVGYVAFNQSPAGPDTSPALLYSPIPLLILAALRFGLGGISASMVAITMLAIWGTMQGRGPFLTQTPEENALALQLFLLMVATPLMLLAVAIDDERRSKEALRVSEQRMSLAVESARLALWDWDVASDTVWMTDEARRFLGFEPGEPRSLLRPGRTRPSGRQRRACAGDPARAGDVRFVRGGVSHHAAPMARCDGSPSRGRPGSAANGAASASARRLDGHHAPEARRVWRRSCSGRSWRIFLAWPP